MFRGTTPKNIFDVNLDCTGAELIYITYSQHGKTIVEKTIEDVTVAEGQITVNLSQEETLRFRAAPVDIQIRVKFPDGSATASNIINTTVEKILKDGVI